MSLQYLSNDAGQIVAVQVPIQEWALLILKYPELDVTNSELCEWQKELIDLRLKAIHENPERILPIGGLIAELDRTIGKNLSNVNS